MLPLHFIKHKVRLSVAIQAYCGRKARSITSNFGAFGASLFVAIATMHSPTCHNPIPVFSPPVPDSISTLLFSSPLLLFPLLFPFFPFPIGLWSLGCGLRRFWSTLPRVTPGCSDAKVRALRALGPHVCQFCTLDCISCRLGKFCGAADRLRQRGPADAALPQ